MTPRDTQFKAYAAYAYAFYNMVDIVAKVNEAKTVTATANFVTVQG